MTLQLFTIFVGLLPPAIGVVSLIGPRRPTEGAAILGFPISLGLVVFVAVEAPFYRRYGGG